MTKSALRILLVDDDKEDYLLIRDILGEIRGTPMRLEWVATYQEAREKKRTRAVEGRDRGGARRSRNHAHGVRRSRSRSARHAVRSRRLSREGRADGAAARALDPLRDSARRDDGDAAGG